VGNNLQDQIEAGLVEIHRLNNLLHPIPRPTPVYLDVGPQVIVADDDGMVVDGQAMAAPLLHEDVEDKELEPVSDEDGEAIFDADSDDEPRVWWVVGSHLWRFFCISTYGSSAVVTMM